MRIIISAFLLFISITTYSQTLNVIPDPSATNLANIITGFQTTVSNAVLNCPGIASGTICTTNDGLGLRNGIVLSSGSVTNLVGPNIQSGITANNFAPGDNDLNNILFTATNDACALEFDFVSCGDNISIPYVFASEEYNSFVGAINDGMGIFLSGAGITGTNNIATINGQPVSVASVNCNFNPGSFVCNDNFFPCGTQNCFDANLQSLTEADGFSTVQYAVASIQADSTYHIKIVIADGSDYSLDSWLIIAAGSYSNYISYAFHSPMSSGILPAAPEDMPLGSITFYNNSGTCNDSACTTVTYGGGAIAGLDYQPLPTSICFASAEDSISYTIYGVQDYSVEPNDTIFVSLTYPSTPISLWNIGCGDTGIIGTIDNYGFVILDAPFFNGLDDITMCEGDSFLLELPFGLMGQWTPSGITSCEFCESTWVYADSSKVITLLATPLSGGPPFTDIINVTVNPLPSVSLSSSDSIVCAGSQVTLTANSTLNNYIWLPSLDTTDIITATIFSDTTIYVVTSNSCGFDTTSQFIQLYQSSYSISNDTSICIGKSVNLNATGFINLTWTPSDGIDNPTASSIIVSPFASVTYFVNGTDSNGCIIDTNVSITLFNNPSIFAGNDIVIINGDSTLIDVLNGNNCVWNPSYDLSNPNSCYTYASPTETTTYTVLSTSSDGCIQTDDIIIEVITPEFLLLPSAFSPNRDGLNDDLRIVSRGNVKVTSFLIYNRWGEKVFEGKDLNSRWDGTYNGEACDLGVYAVYIGYTINDAKKVLNANVSLLR